MDTKEWMIKYLGKEKGAGSSIFYGIVCIGMGIFMMIVGKGETITIVIAMGLIALGGFMAYSAVNKGSTNNWISMMEREGRLQTIKSDFLNAREFFGGDLRLGNEWCFGQGCKVPTAYKDIIRVYQHVHKTNFVEDSRSLLAVTSAGTTKMICNLPIGKRGEHELNQVLTIMLSVNPNIQIGYVK